jgi:hypothetical protein
MDRYAEQSHLAAGTDGAGEVEQLVGWGRPIEPEDAATLRRDEKVLIL